MEITAERSTIRILLDLAPLAAGLLVAGGLIWFLLARDLALGRWLLATLLVGHGWIHAMFLAPLPARTSGSPSPSDEAFARTFDTGRSWLVAVGVDPGVVKVVGAVLIAAVVIGFVLAALSTVSLLVPAGWWASLVIGSASLSTVLLTLFFSPTLVLGFGINLVLLRLALAPAWSPAAAAGGGIG